MKNGEGVFVWPDGRSYRGHWSNGKQDGAGVTVDVNGVETKGEWKNGERIKAHLSWPLKELEGRAACYWVLI